ncbi:hypothetical protein GLX27_001187 [Malassezia furfur]|uniref:C2H2-type domain-containing protein n=1 Tax=Malassezia furfur TaxID=55194 RepID=A0ABY8EQ39_MALFU|nr:hypothetical protein GLX27_001187 [Malassezia furfur]
MAREDAMPASHPPPPVQNIAPWPAPVSSAVGTSVPSDASIAPVPTAPITAPDAAPDRPVARDLFAPVQDAFLDGMVPPAALPGMDYTDARVQDASANPSMNLLLSLTLRLVPNDKTGELGNAFDFAHTPTLLPSASAPAGLTAVPAAPGAPSVPSGSELLGAGLGAPAPAAVPAASLAPGGVAPGLSTDDMGNVATASATPMPLAPFAGATEAAATSCLPTALPALDSLASAASETAASEFADASLYANAGTSTSAPALPSYLVASQTSPAHYLSMMRQASLGMQAPRTDSPRAASASPVATSSAALLPTPVGTPRSMPVTRTSSVDETIGTFALPTADNDTARLGGIKTEGRTALADATVRDDDAQRRAIEEAVRNLSTHHRLAQTAAVRHHQCTQGLVDDKKRAAPAPEGDAKRARSHTPTAAELKAQLLSKSGAVELERSASASELPTHKRFQCPKCSRAFARAYNLNTHLSTHDPDPSRAKPFSCPYTSCKSEGGRSFSRKHDLQRHVASVHEWEPEPGLNESTGEVVEGHASGGLASLGLGAPGKKFRCEKCARAFVRRDALRRHHCERDTSAQASSASPRPAFGRDGDAPHPIAFQLMTGADAKAHETQSASGTPPVSAIRVAR